MLNKFHSLIGFNSDVGVKRNNGRVGASKGYDAIRKHIFKIKDNENNIKDFGSIDCIGDNLEQAQEDLASLITSVRKENIFPLVIGGGHETSWGHYLGFKNFYKNKKITILNFDAHFDLRDLKENNLGTSGTPFYQIYLDCKKENRAFDYNCIGIQSSATVDYLFKRAKDLNVNYLLAEEIEKADKFIDKIISRSEVIYLSICLDVFAKSVAPGVSAPQDLGLMPNKVIELLKKLFKSGKIIATDIVEMAPNYDIEQKTAKLAAQISMEYYSNVC